MLNLRTVLSDAFNGHSPAGRFSYAATSLEFEPNQRKNFYRGAVCAVLILPHVLQKLVQKKVLYSDFEGMLGGLSQENAYREILAKFGELGISEVQVSLEENWFFLLGFYALFNQFQINMLTWRYEIATDKAGGDQDQVLSTQSTKETHLAEQKEIFEGAYQKICRETITKLQEDLQFLVENPVQTKKIKSIDEIIASRSS